MQEGFVDSPAVQQLLDKVAGTGSSEGDDRIKAVVRDLVEQVMRVIVRHDLSEGEVWQGVNFLQEGADEFGLIMPGLGIEHFLDLYMDEKDKEAGRDGGTPRTIEGPLYVQGAPLEPI